MPRLQPISPVEWSQEARDRLAKRTNVAVGIDLGVHPDTVGRWANGRAVTPAGRIKDLATHLHILGGKHPRLTPADLGRPDLGRAGK